MLTLFFKYLISLKSINIYSYYNPLSLEEKFFSMGLNI